MKKRFDICITFAKNYLHFARSFTENFLKFHPDSRVFGLLVDELNGEFDPEKEKFIFIDIKELKIKNYEAFTFKYIPNDLNTAVKPRLLEYLYNKYSDIEKLCYFDPDIRFYKPIKHIEDLLDDYNFVVTPHLTAPVIEDGHSPSDLTMLIYGTYNLGFFGTRRSEETFKMLRWWDQKVYDQAPSFLEETGLYTDQKWINLLDGFFERKYVLRDIGYNVAYWNLQERKNIGKKNGEYFVNDKPLFFFHFSGFLIENRELLSRHQDRYMLKDMNETVRGIFEEYRKSAINSGYYETKKWKYAYGFFDNGIKISSILRNFYFERNDLRKAFPNPYRAGPKSYFEWLMFWHDNKLTCNLLDYVYSLHTEMHKTFGDIGEHNFIEFARWGQKVLKEKYNVEQCFIEEIDKLIKRNAMTLI